MLIMELLPLINNKTFKADPCDQLFFMLHGWCVGCVKSDVSILLDDHFLACHYKS